MAKVLIATLVLLLAADACSASQTSRAQIERMLASQIPSGSSAAMVAKFLDSHGVVHGVPEKSGPSMILLGTFSDSAGGRLPERGSLQVRFSFLQDRLIGYSFTELPATH